MIYAVTGKGRSGTSIVMQMLAAGGMPIVCDPHTLGCSFESGQAQSNAEYMAARAPGWHGQAIKILEPQVFTPPTGHAYRFVWCRRDYMDQALSTIKYVMKANDREKNYPTVAKLAKTIRKDSRRQLRRLKAYPDSKLMIVDFAKLLTEPAIQARRIADFIEQPLDVEAMAAEVIPRTTGVYTGFLAIDIMKRHDARVAAIKAESGNGQETTTAD